MITPKRVINVFLFFSLMPYVSPVPLGSDVQILAGLMAYFFLTLLALRDAVYFDKREFLLLILCFIFLVHINIEEDTYQLRKAVGPLYAFGILYVSKRYHHLFDRRTIFIVIIVYIVAAVIQVVSFELFSMTFEKFLRESKYLGGARGATSMTTEPGFLGYIGIYISVILSWLHRDQRKDRYYYFFQICAIALVLLSKSGTGYVILFMLMVYNFKTLIVRHWLKLSIVTVLSLFILSLSPIDLRRANKGISDLTKILTLNPQVIFQLTSVSARINPMIVGLYSLKENPLGNGSGSFTTKAVRVYDENKLYDLYPKSSYLQYRLRQEISTDSVSAFGKYIFEYGIFFLMYLLILFLGIDYKRTPFSILIIIVLSLSFSLPIVYPPLWLIVGVYDKRAIALNKPG